jgi:hypothetical protein
VIHQVLEIGPHVTALPVVHGSGDFAWEVRRLMMKHDYDCLAVALPASFQQNVETAILDLPTPGVVIQRSETFLPPPDFSPRSEFDPQPDDPLEEFLNESDANEAAASYVPIDPCQPVIAALRTAMGDRKPRHFIDLETSHYLPHARSMPDAFALKKLSLQRYASAVLPFVTAGKSPQWRQRVKHMAWQLRQLSVDYKRILFVTSVLDWPWVRESFFDRGLICPENETVADAHRFQVKPETLYFLLGELPFITNLYERARQELSDDEHLGIDGVKELLIAARDTYTAEYKSRARKITPSILSKCLKYTRNLTLIESGFTPQLATIITAAQQVSGDGYAMHVLEMAKTFNYTRDLDLPEVRLGIDQIGMDGGEPVKAANRLPGPPMTWTQLKLKPRPDQDQKHDWQQKWNPYSQCSWPPEDDLIESFRRTVFDRAQEALGADLVQTEKFTTSVKDGIDIRDTVRNWYSGEIYVKVLPPSRGKMDTAVMLFDSPADPREYPWRTTWFAEHKDESTLAFYATDFTQQPVGPGICLGNYGGALFIYPPVAIPDIWQDPRLDFATTLEERLLGAACLHSQCKHIALVSSAPPGHAWRQIAKQFKKSWVHLPLSKFSDSTVQNLRMVHVLNGKEIRSFAADFIRRS